MPDQGLTTLLEILVLLPQTGDKLEPFGGLLAGWFVVECFLFGLIRLMKGSVVIWFFVVKLFPVFLHVSKYFILEIFHLFLWNIIARLAVRATLTKSIALVAVFRPLMSKLVLF